MSDQGTRYTIMRPPRTGQLYGVFDKARDAAEAAHKRFGPDERLDYEWEVLPIAPMDQP